MSLVAKMKEYDKDRYGRPIVELFTEDNKRINAAMICSGAAWWCEYYAPDRPQFKQCQEDAQRNKRGLWAGRDPVALGVEEKMTLDVGSVVFLTAPRMDSDSIVKTTF